MNGGMTKPIHGLMAWIFCAETLVTAKQTIHIGAKTFYHGNQAHQMNRPHAHTFPANEAPRCDASMTRSMAPPYRTQPPLGGHDDRPSVITDAPRVIHSYYVCRMTNNPCRPPHGIPQIGRESKQRLGQPHPLFRQGHIRSRHRLPRAGVPVGGVRQIPFLLVRPLLIHEINTRGNPVLQAIYLAPVFHALGP